MPKFYCLHAYDVSCYSQPFAIEAATQEEAETKLDALRQAGAFDNVLCEPEFGTTDNPRTLIIYEISEGDSGPLPVEQLPGFTPPPK